MAPLSQLSDLPLLPPHPSPFPPPLPNDKPGLCGLTGHQWHILLIFIFLRESVFTFPNPGGLGAVLTSHLRALRSTVLLALPVALIFSWYKSKDPCLLWLEAQQRAEVVRKGMFLSAMARDEPIC